MSGFNYVQELVDEFNKRKQQELREILLREIFQLKLQMTTEQIQGLGKILGGRDLMDIPEKNLIHTCDLCFRTVKKNKEGRSPPA